MQQAATHLVNLCRHLRHSVARLTATRAPVDSEVSNADLLAHDALYLSALKRRLAKGIEHIAVVLRLGKAGVPVKHEVVRGESRQHHALHPLLASAAPSDIWLLGGRPSHGKRRLVEQGRIQAEGPHGCEAGHIVVSNAHHIIGRSPQHIQDIHSCAPSDTPHGASASSHDLPNAELLRLIAERADHDIEGSGWGDYSLGHLGQPLAPAEAATEPGADSPNPATAEAWLLARWFARWPRLAPWVVSVGIVLLMGLAGSGDDEIEQLSAERAEELASAQELQP